MSHFRFLLRGLGVAGVGEGEWGSGAQGWRSGAFLCLVASKQRLQPRTPCPRLSPLAEPRVWLPILAARSLFTFPSREVAEADCLLVGVQRGGRGRPASESGSCPAGTVLPGGAFRDGACP